ncbi:MAG: hypothetical protein JRI36_06025 [Deltaproteobacteria bacterium]|nr:hypothetical protein [Deltaproteobacteria bacterium]
MNKAEKKTWQERYSYCTELLERPDIVFVYPREFSRTSEVVVEKLQEIMDYLKYITGLNPTYSFKQRTVVGYRHPDNEGGKECQPGWLPNWVNIPWNYLKKPDEPMDACSHELVHPFFRCSPLHYRNEGWGEGFCDFLRGPVKRVVGLDGANWWQTMLEAAKDGKDSEYHYPAGQFALMAYEKFGQRSGSIEAFLNDSDGIRAFVRYLFSNFEYVSLSTLIMPSPKMEKKWMGKDKI